MSLKTTLFPWLKAGPKPKPRVFPIPDDHIVRVLRLRDEYYAAKAEADAELRYHLWKAINEAVPETRAGSWGLNLDDATHPKVIERLGGER